MQDQELDKIVQKWADEETASAPKMRPTAEMYEHVASLGRRRWFGFVLARRSAWATALAVAAVLILALSLVQLSPLSVPGKRSQVAQVPQRAAFGPVEGQPPRGKGTRGGTPQFGLLVFQVQGTKASTVRSVDMLAASPTTMVLADGDSYRLVLEPLLDRFVYVYLRMPSGALALLYPNEAYNLNGNPMRAAETTYLPAEPNGFNAEGSEGSYRLYVIAAGEEVPELLVLHERLSRQGIWWDRRKSLGRLQEQLDALASGLVEGARGWVLEYEVR